MPSEGLPAPETTMDSGLSQGAWATGFHCLENLGGGAVGQEEALEPRSKAKDGETGPWASRTSISQPMKCRNSKQ